MYTSVTLNRYYYDYYETHKYDLMAFSETWLNSADDNDPHIISLLPDGYSMQHVDRDSGERGGGVALVYKQSISVKCKKVKKYDQFEYMMCSLSLKHKSIVVVLFYRPPPSQDNGLTTATFMNEFSEFLSQCDRQNCDRHNSQCDRHT